MGEIIIVIPNKRNDTFYYKGTLGPLGLSDWKASGDVNCVHDAGGDRGDELSHLAAALKQPTRRVCLGFRV